MLISPTIANSNVVTPTAATSNAVTPTVEKTNNGFQTVGKKKKKGKSNPTTGGPSVKQIIMNEPKATTSVQKKGTTNVGNASKVSFTSNTTITSTKEGNIATSNPYYALQDKSDDDVENVYDESANLFQISQDGKEQEKKENVKIRVLEEFSPSTDIKKRTKIKKKNPDKTEHGIGKGAKSWSLDLLGSMRGKVHDGVSEDVAEDVPVLMMGEVSLAESVGILFCGEMMISF
ncbi:hypothetical protein Tco_0815246 [Tanacetum coccineum]